MSPISSELAFLRNNFRNRLQSNEQLSMIKDHSGIAGSGHLPPFEYLELMSLVPGSGQNYCGTEYIVGELGEFTWTLFPYISNW